MSTLNRFRRKNIPNEKIEKNKEWCRKNPHIARRFKPSMYDWYELEVYSCGTGEKIAKDLHKALKDSGFLAKYPLFTVRVDPM